MTISIYILVELKSSVRKLLPQLARDQCQTWKYYEAPHGDGHKGVDRRRFAAPAKSAARFPPLQKMAPCFSFVYDLCIRGSSYLTFQNAAMPKGERSRSAMLQCCS